MRRGSASSRGYGAKWRKIRKAALYRDMGLCVHCRSRGDITVATEVDHIVRKADGGTDDLDNLQSLCRPCHEAKTAVENGGKDMACDANGIPINANPYWGEGASNT